MQKILSKIFTLPTRNIRLHGMGICMVALVFMVCTTAFSQGTNRSFQAGAHKSNITPKLGGPIIGNWNSPAAEYVHDELYARSIVLDDGETKLVVVTVDNVGVDQKVFDAAKQTIEQATGIPASHVLIASTHTHSATSARGVGDKGREWHVDDPLDDYQSFMASRIADGVQIAFRNLEPARIGWGFVDVPQHVFNRRWKMKPGTPTPNPLGGSDIAVMNPGVGNPNLLEPAGPTDPEVAYLSIQAIDGRPLALLANYSLHYVGGVPSGEISADYFGMFADKMQELLGADRQNPGFVAMMSNGTSGDINNINFRGPSVKHPPYGKMKLVADDVAKAVMKGYHDISYQDWVPLGARASTLNLKVRRPSPELAKFVEEVNARPESVEGRHRLEKTYATRIKQLETFPDDIDVIIQGFKIGDLSIGAIPFETFVEIGLELKEKSPMKDHFTIALANGLYGYLPTPDQHKMGGYETWLSTNRVEEVASDKIIAQLLDLLEDME